MQAFVGQQLHETEFMLRPGRRSALLGAGDRGSEKEAPQHQNDASCDTEDPHEISLAETPIGSAAHMSKAVAPIRSCNLLLKRTRKLPRRLWMVTSCIIWLFLELTLGLRIEIQGLFRFAFQESRWELPGQPNGSAFD
jgi:hypothetical protein